jgi:hypothetical protein
MAMTEYGRVRQVHVPGFDVRAASLRACDFTAPRVNRQ